MITDRIRRHEVQLPITNYTTLFKDLSEDKNLERNSENSPLFDFVKNFKFLRFLESGLHYALDKSLSTG